MQQIAFAVGAVGFSIHDWIEGSKTLYVFWRAQGIFDLLARFNRSAPFLEPRFSAIFSFNITIFANRILLKKGGDLRNLV